MRATECHEGVRQRWYVYMRRAKAADSLRLLFLWRRLRSDRTDIRSTGPVDSDNFLAYQVAYGGAADACWNMRCPSAMLRSSDYDIQYDIMLFTQYKIAQWSPMKYKSFML